LLVFLTGAAGPAAADQNDPRLDDLFERLKAASNYGVAQPIEAAIWGIWGETDDTAVRILMDDGVAAMARRDYRAALEKFDQVVTIAPGFAEGWNKRATVDYLIGLYPASLGDIAKTLALEPRHFGALSGRGLVYIELDEEQLALESFEAALAIHPNQPGAAMNAKVLRKRVQDRAI
jgi:tetratricopeptide (TPR) repeat protein